MSELKMTEKRDAMEAGRELDARIAIALMGWEWSVVGNTPWQLIPPGDDRFIVRNCPHYSSDIASGFQVVEAMREKGWHYELRDTTSGQHAAAFATGRVMGGKPFSVTADDLPLAICLAALRAIEASPRALPSSSPANDNG